MESIGLLFTCILCPIIGLVLTIKAIVDYQTSKNKKKIFIGLSLFLVPLFSFILSSIYENHYENCVVGTYTIKDQKEIVLVISDDKTFEINKPDKKGKGTWTISQDDNLTLDLKLNNDKYSDIYYTVNNSDIVELSGNGSTLVKTLMPSH